MRSRGWKRLSGMSPGQAKEQGWDSVSEGRAGLGPQPRRLAARPPSRVGGRQVQGLLRGPPSLACSSATPADAPISPLGLFAATQGLGVFDTEQTSRLPYLPGRTF